MHLPSFHSFVRVSVQLGALQICIITCFGVGIVLLRLLQAPLRHGLRRLRKLGRDRSPTLFGAYRRATAVIGGFQRVILCPLRFALNNSVPAATDLFAVVQLRCRAIGAVFLPPCALHQEILLANLASPWIVSVVQSFKEVCQHKAVIALKGHSSGSDKDATVSPFRESNIFRVQGK